MQFPTILFKTLAIAGIVAAAPLAPLSQPSAELVARQASNTTTSGTTQLTFTGAGASFSVTASVNGQEFSIPNAISIDFIAQVGTASCSFTGVDRARLTVVGANSGATLAPPQTVATGLCE